MATSHLEAFGNLLITALQENLHRFNKRMNGGGRSLDLEIAVEATPRVYRVLFQANKERAVLILPRPRKNHLGNWVVGDRCERALCPLMLVAAGLSRHINYEQMIMYMLLGNLSELFPEQGTGNHLDRIFRGFLAGQDEKAGLKPTGRLAVTRAQRFLNQNLFNIFPLTGTALQDWAMNRRLMIFDPIFRDLSPEKKLAYQRRKNEVLHPWGSIGLSDGAAATNNYILQADLREITAFGLRHHNPMRNLYSTLGMQGDEPATVISQSAKQLEDQGISRGGWNWMTVFLDVPSNFEDQILVDRRHANKTIVAQRTFNIFGMPTVSVGDTIRKGRALGINADESPVTFDLDCEHAKVLSIEDSLVPFDGQDEPVVIITLEVTYALREGVKITNQHGNKGVIAIMDLGSVLDPVRGQIPIDVIVSARSVQKRKNFGQVLEAWTTLIHGTDKRQIIPDDLAVTEDQLRVALSRAGQSPEGTCPVQTPWGEFETICGWVHWGVTKTPEEQLWQGEDTWTENQRGIRQRGNKVSTVEMRALTTLLGSGSAVVQEVLSHQQGVSEVEEYLCSLRTLREQYQDRLPVVERDRFCYIPAGQGTFHGLEQLYGTIADETLYPDGCYLQLPFRLKAFLPDDPSEEMVEGTATQQSAYAAEPKGRTFETDRLHIPAAVLRQPWRHPTGKWALSDVATALNQILEGLDRLSLGEVKEEQVATLIHRYLRSLSRGLSTKTGKISQFLMAVRYPWSSKATATLGRDLPPNTVEIHVDMAKDLRVMPGDLVLIERFPCLGFMSTRIQRVKITTDPACKYVIRASGNSLVSMNLDFDGDVVYIMSFHTEAAKRELTEAFNNPHPRVKEVLESLNNRKQPITQATSLSQVGLTRFETLTPTEHADLNALSLAVKLYTGPTIALCYNLMRIIEGSFPYTDREAHINVEVFLDKVGNSVFSQKHGVRSLREECIEAVCLANAAALVKLGFPERESVQLCQAIRTRAASIGLRNDDALQRHYQRHLAEGRPNVISAIVRRCHPLYYATRSDLHPVLLMDALETQPNDLVAHLVQRGLQK